MRQPWFDHFILQLSGVSTGSMATIWITIIWYPFRGGYRKVLCFLKGMIRIRGNTAYFGIIEDLKWVSIHTTNTILMTPVSAHNMLDDETLPWWPTKLTMSQTSHFGGASIFWFNSPFDTRHFISCRRCWKIIEIRVFIIILYIEIMLFKTINRLLYPIFKNKYQGSPFVLIFIYFINEHTPQRDMLLSPLHQTILNFHQKTSKLYFQLFLDSIVSTLFLNNQ